MIQARPVREDCAFEELDAARQEFGAPAMSIVGKKLSATCEENLEGILIQSVSVFF
jgi:hypothetical protein